MVVLLGAILAGAAIGVGPELSKRTGTTASYARSVSGCRVTDGDTIRCGGERIRLWRSMHLNCQVIAKVAAAALPVIPTPPRKAFAWPWLVR